MSGIGIITNPFSKLNKRNPSRSNILGYILGKKGVMEATESLEHLSRVAHKFHEQKIDILAINGGDGTISRTLSAFIAAYGDTPLPKVAVLRGGTMNVLSNYLGIRGEPELLLCSLIQMDSRESILPIKRVRLLKVEDHFGFIFADGTIASLLEEYYKDKRGVPAAILLFLRAAASFFTNEKTLYRRLVSSSNIQLTPHPHLAFSCRSLTVFASTINKLPLGARLLKEEAPDPGSFQTVVVTSDPEKLLWHLPNILLTTKKGHSLGKAKFFCNHLLIESEKPSSYTLDGEVFNSASTKIEVTLDREVEFILIK